MAGLLEAHDTLSNRLKINNNNSRKQKQKGKRYCLEQMTRWQMVRIQSSWQPASALISIQIYLVLRQSWKYHEDRVFQKSPVRWLFHMGWKCRWKPVVCLGTSYLTSGNTRSWLNELSVVFTAFFMTEKNLLFCHYPKARALAWICNLLPICCSESGMLKMVF